MCAPRSCLYTCLVIHFIFLLISGCSACFAADELPPASQKVRLIVRINVPHNIHALDWCRIYPYPVAPPARRKEIGELSTNTKDLRESLRSIAYVSISRKEKPFPTGGWRMQYAYKAALAKSGLGLPHTIVTMYPWIEEMLPYVRREIVLSNLEEKERNERYELAETVFRENRADLEVQAFNKGLFPMDVPIRKKPGHPLEGTAQVDKVNWWIVALHKVPGLKYYWLWPVKLNDSPEQVATLTEDNAIFIEGAW